MAMYYSYNDDDDDDEVWADGYIVMLVYQNKMLLFHPLVFKCNNFFHCKTYETIILTHV